MRNSPRANDALRYHTAMRPRARTLVLLPLLCCTLSAAAPVPGEVKFFKVPGKLTVTIGGVPFATYALSGDDTITRPYFANVYAPGGVRVTRTHPPVEGTDDTDHAHLHPGVWLSFSEIGGADPWRNKTKVLHNRFAEEPKGGGGTGSFAVVNRYLAADGKTVLCEETCRFTVLVRPAGHLLVVDSLFRTDAPDGIAFGDQEEMGMAVRVATPLAVAHGGRMLDSEGRVNGEQIWGKTALWCDYAGKLPNAPWAGITLMPDPANPAQSRFHARDYGMLAANPFGRKAFGEPEADPVKITPDQPVRLRFGVLFHAQAKDAKPQAPAHDPKAAYADFVELLKELPRPE